MKSAALSIEKLREAVMRLPDDALAATREAALANLDEYGLPSVKDEDWRYTDLSSAIDISNRWLSEGAASASADTLRDAILSISASIDANWLVIANGRVDLSCFVESSNIDVERFSDSATPFVMDRPLADLNAALLHDGLRVQIHGATEKPLGILIIDEANAGAGVSQANIEIEIAPGCDAEIIEYHSSAGTDDHYSNSVIALQVDQGAHVGYVRIQERRIGHVQTGRLSAALGADARLNMASYDLGGGLIRNDLDVVLAGEGAECELRGLFLGSGSRLVDNHTAVDHAVPHCSSRELYKGILGGRSKGVFRGRVVVRPDAQKTDAFQSNPNLLLGDGAEIDTKPQLEIYADDVKCSHGATVGQLEEDALFYLRSRGIGLEDARALMIRAFANEIIDQLPIPGVADSIADSLHSTLANDRRQHEASA